MRLNYETLGEERQKHGPRKRFRGRRPPPRRGRPACAETRLAGHRLAPPLPGQRESRRGVPGGGAVPALALPLCPLPCLQRCQLRRSPENPPPPRRFLRPPSMPQVGAARPPPGARTAPAGAGSRRARFPSLLPTAPGSRPFPAQLGRSLGSGVGGGHPLPAASRDRPPGQRSGASSACLRPGFLQSRRRQLRRALLPGQVALDCRAALAPGRSWGRLLQVYPSSSPRGPQYECVW